MKKKKNSICRIIILCALFAVNCMGIKLIAHADSSANPSTAVFLDVDGTVAGYCSSGDLTEIVPPEGPSKYEWAQEDYSVRTGPFVVLPSVIEPETDKVYTGVFVNNRFVPVFDTNIKKFSGRDDGSTYYYQGIPESAAVLDWNGLTTGFQDQSAMWRAGSDPMTLTEELTVLFDNVKDVYVEGYFTPSAGGTTFLAPTAESCRFYTVTFIWPEGIETQLVRFGQSAEPPVLEEKYKNWEWSSSLYQDVQGELYVGLYNPAESKVSANWRDYDETFLAQASVPAGIDPLYPGVVPQRDADDDYIYMFSGWEKTTASAGEITYRAKYKSIPRWTVTVRYCSYDGLQLATQSGRYTNHVEYSFTPPHINGYVTPDVVSGTIEDKSVERKINCAPKTFYGKQGYMLDDQFAELDDVIVHFNTGTYCVYHVGYNNTTRLKVTYNDGAGEKDFYFKAPVYGSTSASFGDMWLYGTSPEEIKTPFLKAMGDADQYLFMRYVGLRPTTTISDLEPLYVAYAEKFYTVTFVYPDAIGDMDPVTFTTVEGGEVLPPELPDTYDWESDAYKNVTGRLEIHAKQICEGHKPVIDAGVPPTCEENGLTQGTHCELCGRILEAQEVISATGHSPVEDLAVDPSCLEGGLSKGSHCSNCGKILTEQKEIPPLGHSWEQPDYLWDDDYSSVTATHTCSRDPSHVETETVETSSKVAEAPTWDKKGKTEYTAVFQNPAFTVQKATAENLPVIPLEGNTWGTCPWVLYDGTLTVSPGQGENTAGISPWTAYKDHITEVIFEDGVRFPQDASGLFKAFNRAEIIDISNVKTDGTEDFRNMFSGCKVLQSLDLSAVNTKNASEMEGMFDSCTSLVSVNLGADFSFSGSGDHMLTTLPTSVIWKNQNEQKMSALQVAKKNLPGVYSGIRPVLFWGTCPLDFEDGIMTVYLGNGRPRASRTYYNDQNSWTTVFYYPWSSESMKNEVKQLIFTEGVHFPEESVYLIWDMPALESVTLEEGVDTSDVTSFTYAFAGSQSALKRIDLTGVTSESLLDTSDMFHGAVDSGVEELILGPGFTCEHVTDMEYMFTYLPSLKHLDLSHFDPSSAVKASTFLKKCDSLEELDLSGNNFSNTDTLSIEFGSLTALKKINLSGAEFPPAFTWSYLKKAQDLELAILGKDSTLPLSFYQSLPIDEIAGAAAGGLDGDAQIGGAGWFCLDSQTFGSAQELLNAVRSGEKGILVKAELTINQTESTYDRKAHSVAASLQAPEGFSLQFRRDSSEEWSLQPPTFTDASPSDQPYQIMSRVYSEAYNVQQNCFMIEQTIHPRQISDSAVTVSDQRSYIAVGHAIEPSWTLSYAGDPLIPESDYVIIRTENNEDPGEGSVTIKGLNSFAGERTLTFTIYDMSALNVLKLPAGLTRVEEYAFTDTDAQVVVIPSDCTEIREGAFSQCASLIGVQIPDNVTKIDPRAFIESDIVIYAPQGSYAETYAEQLNIPFVQIQTN